MVIHLSYYFSTEVFVLKEPTVDIRSRHSFESGLVSLGNFDFDTVNNCHCDCSFQVSVLTQQITRYNYCYLWSSIQWLALIQHLPGCHSS